VQAGVMGLAFYTMYAAMLRWQWPHLAGFALGLAVVLLPVTLGVGMVMATLRRYHTALYAAGDPKVYLGNEARLHRGPAPGAVAHPVDEGELLAHAWLRTIGASHPLLIRQRSFMVTSEARAAGAVTIT